jgi:hypothetical protein
VIRFLLSFALLVPISCTATAEPVSQWLVIAASTKTVQPALKVKQRLSPSWPEIAIVASSDCKDLRTGLFLAVVKTFDTKKGAASVLGKIQEQVPDAYVRECRPYQGSRIQLGVSLIDPSIEKVPQDAVNWTDEDRVSDVVKLPGGGGYLWILRRYEADEEGPREGRRESVLVFANKPEAARVLEGDCTDPGYARIANWIALSCARERALDHLLHQTTIFDMRSGKKVHSVSRCRDPEFASTTELVCQEEAVDKQGRLQLKRKSTQFRSP